MNESEVTYAKMLHNASRMPNAALSVMTRPPVKAPMTTIKHVFACPTTVLSTAPAPPMMKNCLYKSVSIDPKPENMYCGLDSRDIDHGSKKA